MLSIYIFSQRFLEPGELDPLNRRHATTPGPDICVQGLLSKLYPYVPCMLALVSIGQQKWHYWLTPPSGHALPWVRGFLAVSLMHSLHSGCGHALGTFKMFTTAIIDKWLETTGLKTITG